MSFFTAVGNMAQTAKLNAEIAMIDREMAGRKKTFGIELYDIIAKQQKQNAGAMLDTPGIFKTIENEIQVPLEKASKEIRVMELEKRNCGNEIEVIEAKNLNNVEAGGTGKSWGEHAKVAELNVKIAYLDREMKIRKEQFGLEVYDACCGPQWLHEALVNETKDKSGLGIVTGAVGGVVKGVKGTVTKTVGKVSGDERAIEACVNKAKEDIKFMEENKGRKQKAIDALK